MAERVSVVDWLQNQLRTREIFLAKLPGATSSTLFRVDTPGRSYVLRVFEASRWLEPVDDLPAREARILQALAPGRLPTPRLVASAGVDSSIGAAVLMTRLPGTVHLPRTPSKEWMTALARGLACVHAQTNVRLPWRYRSWQTMTGEPAPDWFANDALWRAVQNGITKKPTTANQLCLLHRDYHPVNVLWQDGKISGIVDWVNACMGPPGVDVAHCRLNLVLMYGLPAADTFLDEYRQAAGDYQHDGYWDLDAALAWFPEPTSYPPWQVFGLGTITVTLLTERIRTFLANATEGTSE